MPELPEVETIRKGLAKRIVGEKIVDVDILNAKSFQGEKDQVVGQTIDEILRRAKLVQIKLGNGKNLLFHLKLTGQLIVIDHNERFAGGHPSHDWHAKLPNSNTRIVFDFGNQLKMYFNDMRKFGWCKVLDDDQVAAIYEKDYGLEPLDRDFTPEYLIGKGKRLGGRNIKQFLMDQTIAAGMGNIYTDEALFDAKVSPLRKVRDISMVEWRQLIVSMRKVLELGLKYGGTTDSDYVDSEGKKGGMQNHLKVYHQTGTQCSCGCGGKVERIVVGGRGTHFCPNCQK